MPEGNSHADSARSVVARRSFFLVELSCSGAKLFFEHGCEIFRHDRLPIGGENSEVFTK